MTTRAFAWWQRGSPDPEGAEDFYEAVFGWSFTERHVGDRTARVSDVGVLLLPQAPGEPTGWTPWAEVGDLDEALLRIEDLGGTIAHGPEELAGLGRAALVRDPDGAMFGLLERAGAPTGSPATGSSPRSR